MVVRESYISIVNCLSEFLIQKSKIFKMIQRERILLEKVGVIEMSKLA